MRYFTCFWYIFFLVFALISGKTVANDNLIVIKQNRTIDSLKLLIDIYPLAEKKKMEIYREIAESFHLINHDSSVFYAYKSMKIARKIKAHETQIKLYSILGITHSFASNYDSAFFYFDRMKEMAIERRDIENETRALSMIAFTYAKQGKYHTSI